nr:energy transducer TonB [Marivirga aurantiaca]
MQAGNALADRVKSSTLQPSKKITTKPFSDEKTITGRVTDAETGEGLPGVNILVKNSSVGVNTDLDGNFEISAKPDDIIIASYIGMQKEEVSVDNYNIVDIELQPDVNQLSEVVVTAYDKEAEKDDSYSAAQPEVGYKDFRKYLENNLQYPEKAKESKTEGNVRLKITISPSGAIKDIEVLKGLGDGCDEEAIRLIKEGPSWEPAKRGSQPVESTQRVKIKFKL